MRGCGEAGVVLGGGEQGVDGKAWLGTLTVDSTLRVLNPEQIHGHDERNR